MAPHILTGTEIGPAGFGMMSLIWRPQPPPKRQAFDAMTAVLELGANFWNGADFYGPREYNFMTLLKE